MMNMTTRIKQLNSAKELQAEKRRLLELSKTRKVRLDNRVNYFMQNSGSILLGTVSYHFLLKQLPIIGNYISQREKDSSINSSSLRSNNPLTSTQKVGSILSAVWSVAQPFILSAIFKRAGSFFGKKK